ncbi:MAG TPA: redoxin family protein [Tepidisphaeraceae bacterium]|nr:redoxin family protein [Tepidisphaeraceae bacterium]
MLKRFAAIVASCALACLIPTAQGAIGKGDSVTSISMKTVDGASINLGKLKGKLVLIDFWATWCGPCMHEAPHMVDINKKYGTRGLILLGVSLDRDAAAMKNGAKAAGLSWPQTIDPKLSNLFGVDSIPRTFLVGPDGTVLWTGHPAAGLDQAIDDAFKNHPPFLVDPKVMADATKVLDQVEEKLAAKDAKGALKLMAKVPAAAKADADFAARATDVQKKLADAADAMLGDVDGLVTSGDYLQAVSRLQDLSQGMPGLPVSAKARKKLTELMAKPEVKSALAAAKKSEHDAEMKTRSQEALAVAQKLQDQKRDEQAYTHFKQVAADYAGTEAATTAAGQVKIYEQQNPELVKKARESAASVKARAALSMADSYKRSGRTDLAKAKYERVIKDFAGTSFADKAKEELAQFSDQ